METHCGAHNSHKICVSCNTVELVEELTEIQPLSSSGHSVIKLDPLSGSSYQEAVL